MTAQGISCFLKDLVALSSMQDAISDMEVWAQDNERELNGKKTKDMLISFKKSCPSPSLLRVGDTEIDRVKSFSLLGTCLQNDLKWYSHVSNIIGKASKRIYQLRACRKANLPIEIGLCIYKTNIRPMLEYACPIWGCIPQYLEDDLQRMQDRCMNIIGVQKDTLESLAQRRDL